MTSLFQQDQKRVYQQMNGISNSLSEVRPDAEESQQFWRDIWGKYVSHNENAESFKELKKERGEARQEDIVITAEIICLLDIDESFVHTFFSFADLACSLCFSSSITTFSPFCLMLYFLSNLVYFSFLLSFHCLDLSRMLTCLRNSALESDSPFPSRFFASFSLATTHFEPNLSCYVDRSSTNQFIGVSDISSLYL